jgi:hypothetical protein
MAFQVYKYICEIVNFESWNCVVNKLSSLKMIIEYSVTQLHDVIFIIFSYTWNFGGTTSEENLRGKTSEENLRGKTSEENLRGKTSEENLRGKTSEEKPQRKTSEEKPQRKNLRGKPQRKNSVVQSLTSEPWCRNYVDKTLWATYYFN